MHVKKPWSKLFVGIVHFFHRIGADMLLPNTLMPLKLTCMEDRFYESLPVHHAPIGEMLGRETCFRPVPSDWQIVITDIRRSSDAVARGLQRTVNLIATGSIVCVLNISHKHKVVIPFFSEATARLF